MRTAPSLTRVSGARGDTQNTVHCRAKAKGELQRLGRPLPTGAPEVRQEGADVCVSFPVAPGVPL